MEKITCDKDRKLLLDLSRQTIRNYLEGKDAPEINEDLSKFSAKMGVFVTLTMGNDLRGCIGNIFPENQLYRAIIDNSVSSAFRDPRFSPLTKEEFGEINIEISLLTPPEKLRYSNWQELKEKIIPFEYGVVLNFRSSKSTFLPQVWEELPEFEDFMFHLTLKAGFEGDAWKRLNPDIEIYKVEHFSEKEY